MMNDTDRGGKIDRPGGEKGQKHALLLGMLLGKGCAFSLKVERETGFEPALHYLPCFTSTA